MTDLFDRDLIFARPKNLIPLTTPAGKIPEITHHNIAAAIAQLATESGSFAVDTERASGYCYTDRAYLLQLKRENGTIFLIDPIGIEDQLRPLAKHMETEWILHDATQDLLYFRQLQLKPRSIFDTKIAALILGFPSVSLQALVEELLGYTLTKAHSAADWSIRPLSPSMRAYAALDVELLHALQAKLLPLLMESGRYSWFAEECAWLKTFTPPPAKRPSWRKTAHKALIEDRRCLAMLENMWNLREELAQAADIAPNRLLPAEILGEIARRKPRSAADLRRSPLLRKKEFREFRTLLWPAIEKAWKTDYASLPSEKSPPKQKPFPILSKWESQNPAAFFRLQLLRGTLWATAAQLGIRQEVLLEAKIQKQLAWEGWESANMLSEKLVDFGARNWQIQLCLPQIIATFS